MTSRLGRIIVATGAAAALTLGVAACTGSVAKDDVAKSIGEQAIKQNVQAQNVVCPTDLAAQAGGTVRCQFTVGDQPVDAVATVTSVSGSDLHFDVKFEARAYARVPLERWMVEYLGSQNVKATKLTCPGDLPAEVGRSIRCEFTVDEQPVDAVAKITSVQDLIPAVDVTLEPRPIAKALLERSIAEQAGQQVGTTIAASSCSGDLAPTVGAAATCTLKVGAEDVVVDVKVTAVNEGEINYSWLPRT